MTARHENQEQSKQPSTTIVTSLGAHSSPQVQNQNASGDQLRTLTKELCELATTRARCTQESTGGYAAELHHKRTFLADAAKKGHRDLEVSLGPRGGRGSKGTADLIVLRNGNQVSDAGLKYRSKATQTTFDQSNPFDRGRQKIVPKDQLPRVKELSAARAKTGAIKSPDYADTNKNATDRLRFNDVESKPLTKQESMDIVKDPVRYAKQAFRGDVQTYAKTGAVTGALFSAAASAVEGAIDVSKGNKSVGEVAQHVVKDAAIGGVKGAAVGVGAAVVKQGLISTGAKQLARGSAPFAIASSTLEAGIDIAKDVKRWSNGEINGGEVALNAVGHTASAATKGASAYAGAQVGATMGAICGPVGILVGGLAGGTIGYLASSSAIGTFKRWLT